MPVSYQLFSLFVLDGLPEGSEGMEPQLDCGLGLTQQAPDLPHRHVPDDWSQKINDPVYDLPSLPILFPLFSCLIFQLLSPPFPVNSGQFMPFLLP